MRSNVFYYLLGLVLWINRKSNMKIKNTHNDFIKIIIDHLDVLIRKNSINNSDNFEYWDDNTYNTLVDFKKFIEKITIK